MNADLAWLLLVPVGMLLMAMLRIQEGPVLRVSVTPSRDPLVPPSSTWRLASGRDRDR
ncbi:Hypothetical protein A7982_09964 [Minicystis rosea]|nr:Hypothetical protein A7982_09964 [Minicystis rosea]